MIEQRYYPDTEAWQGYPPVLLPKGEERPEWPWGCPECGNTTDIMGFPQEMPDRMSCKCCNHNCEFEWYYVPGPTSRSLWLEE